MFIPFIGIDSFKDALYWWLNGEERAFWCELNSGYYQLNPDKYTEEFFRNY